MLPYFMDTVTESNMAIAMAVSHCSYLSSPSSRSFLAKFQWSPSVVDTLGTWKGVLRCPHFRGKSTLRTPLMLPYFIDSRVEVVLYYLCLFQGCLLMLQCEKYFSQLGMSTLLLHNLPHAASCFCVWGGGYIYLASFPSLCHL